MPFPDSQAIILVKVYVKGELVLSSHLPCVPKTGEYIRTQEAIYSIDRVIWDLYADSDKHFDSYDHPDSEYVTVHATHVCPV